MRAAEDTAGISGATEGRARAASEGDGGAPSAV